MQDLSLHRQEEQGKEIEHKDRPEHRHVENFPKCHKKTDSGGLHGGEPAER